MYHVMLSQFRDRRIEGSLEAKAMSRVRVTIDDRRQSVDSLKRHGRFTCRGTARPASGGLQLIGFDVVAGKLGAVSADDIHEALEA